MELSVCGLRVTLQDWSHLFSEFALKEREIGERLIANFDRLLLFFYYSYLGIVFVAVGDFYLNTFLYKHICRVY